MAASSRWVTHMARRFKLQIVVAADHDQQVSVDELVVLNKQCDGAEQLGLNLQEAQALLLAVQRQVLNSQITAFLASRVPCPTCGRPRGVKDHKTIVFRTVFGKLELASPRLRRCPCQHDGPLSTSPLLDVLPEHCARVALPGQQVVSHVVRVDRHGLKYPTWSAP